MPNTAINGLPYPGYGVGADIPKDLQALADAVAPKLYRAEPLTGSQVAALSSPRIGQLVFNTDVGRSQEWNGTVWRNVGAGANGSTSQTFSVTNGTPITVSFFVGLGYGTVDFTFADTTNNISFVSKVSAVASTAQVIGTKFASNISGYYAFPAAVLDATTQIGAGPNGLVVYNLRLESDGYVRFSVAQNATGTVTSTGRINWGAR